MLHALRTRRLTPEWMDDPALDPAEHRRALRGLRRINALSRTAAAVAQKITRHRHGSADPFKVLDLACGGGDVTLGLQRRLSGQLSRQGKAVRVDGCDISGTAVAEAQGRAEAAKLPCRFFLHDAGEGRLPAGYDCFTSMLFLHHLETDVIVDLLRRMREATPLVVIDDLVRSGAGWALAKVGTRLLSRSPVVHVDGPRSVEGALTPAELIDLAHAAGMTGATVTRRFPQRMLLVWRKR